jgi:predicted acetyltransferase
MDFDIRPAQPEEMGQLGLMASYSYGGAFGDGEDNISASGTRPEWTLCAFDPGATTEQGQVLMATSFAAFPFTIRANGRAMAMAGISVVGTRPEYRRRGLVRRIMTQAFADQRDRGQSVAGLWASQAAIYQRYGFAPAGLNRGYAIDVADIQLQDSVPEPLIVSRHRPAEALDAIREIYKTFIADRTGYIHRGKSLWLNSVLSEDGANSADGPVYVALAGSIQAPRGYVVYTLRAAQVPHRARPQEIKVRDMAFLDMPACHSLWQFLARHDLVGRVAWPNAPMDDPAQAMMAEPRMLHTQDTEATWWRLVDVPRALAQRGYNRQARLVVEVHGDDLAPWNNGRWLLQTAGDAGEESKVSTTELNPDITLSIRALSGLFSGMYSAQTLANWGMLSGQPEGISTASGVFATKYGPHCPDHY